MMSIKNMKGFREVISYIKVLNMFLVPELSMKIEISLFLKLWSNLVIQL